MINLARRGALKIAVVGPRRDALPPIHALTSFVDDPDASLSGFDRVVPTFDGEAPAAWAPLIERAAMAGVPILPYARYLEGYEYRLAEGDFDGAQACDAGRAGYRSRKPIFDWLVICALSPFIAVVLIATALAVAMSMGRPILFSQDRVGIDGKVFQMWKFRTMVASVGGDFVTAIGDRRITPLGRVLRRWHVDESPQLVNVLRGEMSLIGPRPEQPDLSRRYSLESSEFAHRLRVMPGLTGWAQVSYSYAGTAAESMIKLGYDLYYIKHQSTVLDLVILARTAAALLRGGGGR